MFVIGNNTLVSLDVLEKEFCCDLDTCRGCCCIEGDAGAPLTAEEEKKILAGHDQGSQSRCGSTRNSVQ